MATTVTANLPTRDWKALRACLRDGGRKGLPVVGRKLRIDPTPGTVNGLFLTALVSFGLLERVDGTADEPLEATYRLTEAGKHGAEYGEYQRPVLVGR